MRYIKGSRDLATFMPRAGKPDIIEAFLDGDWACHDLDRKSASGGYLMVADCKATAGRLDSTRSAVVKVKS